MGALARIERFLKKSQQEKIAAIRRRLRTFLNIRKRGKDMALHRMLSGKLAVPNVLRADSRLYLAYRPDLDVDFHMLPELISLGEKWVLNNVLNNAGDLPRLYALSLNVRQVMTDGVDGDFAELGVYRGNSAALLAHYARENNRSVFLFDTFEGFNAADMAGIDANKKQEFTDTSLDLVRQNIGNESVTFVKGHFPRTVTEDIADRKFAVVHLDCDLHDPIKAGLEFFYPRLSAGGLIIVHDYAGVYWDGVKIAVDEYVRQIGQCVIVIPDKSGTAMIRKSR